MKDIEGFEGLYAATKDGRIWSHSNKRGQKRKGRFLRTWLIGRGYEMVMLYPLLGKGRKFLVHRLIAQTWIPNPQNLPEVNHKNADRLDNAVDNLEWVSSKQNKAHAYRLGLYSKNIGSKHHLAKLDEAKVRDIRSLKGQISQAEIARLFDVSPMTVHYVLAGKIWRHVD